MELANKCLFLSCHRASYSVVCATMKHIPYNSRGNVGVQVVVGVLAIVAIILGLVAIQAGSSSKKAVADLDARLSNELMGVQQTESELRDLRSQMATKLSDLYAQITAVREEVKKLAAPPPPPQKEAGGKEKQSEQTPAGPGTYHTIQAGDTFGRLANRYGTTIADIEKLNPGVSSSKLKIGQKVRVK